MLGVQAPVPARREPGGERREGEASARGQARGGPRRSRHALLETSGWAAGASAGCSRMCAHAHGRRTHGQRFVCGHGCALTCLCARLPIHARSYIGARRFAYVCGSTRVAVGTDMRADMHTGAHTCVSRHVHTCTHVCIHNHLLQHTCAWTHVQQPHVCAHTHACTAVTLVAHILARSFGHPLVVLCPGGT